MKAGPGKTIKAMPIRSTVPPTMEIMMRLMARRLKGNLDTFTIYTVWAEEISSRIRSPLAVEKTPRPPSAFERAGSPCHEPLFGWRLVLLDERRQDVDRYGKKSGGVIFP